MQKPNRILCVSVSGIGNTILFTPALRALRRHFPAAQIDLLVWSEAMAAPIEGAGLVSHILIMPDNAARRPAFLLRLRRTQYDVSMLAFPSNKIHFHLLSFLIGARERFSHAYPGFERRTGLFLETRTVPAVEGRHDVEQNLNLLRLFGWDPDPEDHAPVFHLSPADTEFAAGFLRNQGLDQQVLIGMHPGAGGALADWQGSAKRWPIGRFAELADRLIESAGATILVFGGPEEGDLKKDLVEHARQRDRVFPVHESLKRSAALIQRCRLMISNDSGLMHVAAALKVPTLGIFGPTHPARTAPWGAGHRVVQPDPPCPQLLRYPFHTTRSKIRGRQGRSCFGTLSVDRVFKAAEEMLRATP